MTALRLKAEYWHGRTLDTDGNYGRREEQKELTTVQFFCFHRIFVWLRTPLFSLWCWTLCAFAWWNILLCHCDLNLWPGGSQWGGVVVDGKGSFKSMCKNDFLFLFVFRELFLWCDLVECRSNEMERSGARCLCDGVETQVQSMWFWQYIFPCLFTVLC